MKTLLTITLTFLCLTLQAQCYQSSQLYTPPKYASGAVLLGTFTYLTIEGDSYTNTERFGIALSGMATSFLVGKATDYLYKRKNRRHRRYLNF